MTIAEVSKKYGLSADTLRYYERIGLIPAVGRTAGGARSYTQEDCNWVEFARCMRLAGLQVEALVEYVSLFQQGEDTREARRRILLGQRDQLRARIDELQKTLDRLDRKIASYEEWTVPVEKRLRRQEP